MSTPIDQLELKVTSDVSSASSGIQALAGSLERLKTAVSGLKMSSSIGNQISAIGAAAGSLPSGVATNLTSLATGLKSLSGLQNLKLSSSIGNQISNIGGAISSLDSAKLDAVKGLADALNPIADLGKIDLNGATKSLEKFPTLVEDLNKVDFTTLQQNVSGLADAFTRLGAGVQAVSAHTQGLPGDMKNLAGQANQLTNNNAGAGKSYVKLGVRVAGAVASFRRVEAAIGSLLAESNNYVEDLNLFNASMGEYAKEASGYAETVSEIMGIDPGEWMRNQGVFMTITKGFGVASNRAYIMSKNLTQLGYDISSFFNISFAESMQKLGSGIAGELEPLRRIGYDLSVARLQQEAFALGITKSVSAMTQAEKAELRYHAILSQVTVAQGDMARTLEAPANQVRILQAQLTHCARAFGNIFIPALNAILPPIIAAVKAIRLLANAIAGLLGFSLPEIDYSGLNGVSSGAEEAATGLGGAAKKAKDLKNALLGIDELNIISEPDTSGGGGGGGAITDSGFDFDLLEYDFLGDAVTGRVNEIFGKIKPMLEWVQEHLDDIADVVKAIAAGFATWKVSSYLIDAVANMPNILASVKTWFANNKVSVGIGVMVTGFILSTAGAYDIGYEGASLENVLKTGIGNALLVAGSVLTFGTGPVGWIVGFGLMLAVDAIGIKIGADKAKLEADLKSRFGELELTQEQLQSWANDITGSELELQLNLFVNKETAVASLSRQLAEVVTSIESNNYSIACGIEISQADYQADIDSYLENAKQYLQERQAVSGLAVNIVFGGSDRGESLSTFVTEFYSESYEKLNGLGAELKDVVSSAFVDGEWIPDKMAEALELQKEINEILDYVSKIEFEAKMTALKLDVSGSDLTAESFTKLLGEAQTTITENMEKLEGVRLEALKVAQMEFDHNLTTGMVEAEAQALYDEAVATAQQAFLDGRLELSYGTFNFGMDVLCDKYGDEFNQILPILNKTATELLDNGFGVDEQWLSSNVQQLPMLIREKLEGQIADLEISDQAKTNIANLLTSLTPTMEEYTKIANEYSSVGQAVPEGIAKGLHDFHALSALTGNIVSLNYLVGEQLSKDDTFLGALDSAEGVGVELGEAMASGLRNNVSFKASDADDTVSVMLDGMSVATLNATPTLVDNFNALGVDISLGVIEGMDEGLKEDECVGIFKRIGGWFEGLFEINSPSKVFHEYGEFMVAGLMEGLTTINELEQDIIALGKKVMNWFEEEASYNSFSKLGAEAIKGFTAGIGDIFSGTGLEASNGFEEGVESSYPTVQDTVTAWASHVLDWFSDSSYGSVNRSQFGVYADDILNGFRTRLSQKIGSTRTVVTSWASSITSAFAEKVSYNAFYKLGEDTVRGYDAGVAHLMQDSIYQIRNWSQLLITEIKQKLGIHSPSKVFGELAEYCVLGYNNGIESMGKTTNTAVQNWTDSFTSISPEMSFAVDTSALRYYTSDSFTRDISASVAARQEYAVDSTFSPEGMKEAVIQALKETGLLDDVRRQADKQEQTIVQVGNRTISDAVAIQRRANGYAFAK